MAEISPETTGERLWTDGDDLFVRDIRHEGEYVDWHVPNGVKVDVDAADCEDTLFQEGVGRVEGGIEDADVERDEDRARDYQEYVAELASNVPKRPPNFEHVERTWGRDRSRRRYWPTWNWAATTARPSDT
jgi:rhodanese-related sulfurtransferase